MEFPDTLPDKQIELASMLLLVDGGQPECMRPMSSMFIMQRDEYLPVSQGYEDQEKAMKKVVISMLMTMIILLLITLTITVYKSWKQKKYKLELLQISSQNTELINIALKLHNDRQVVLAIEAQNRLIDEAKGKEELKEDILHTKQSSQKVSLQTSNQKQPLTKLYGMPETPDDRL